MWCQGMQGWFPQPCPGSGTVAQWRWCLGRGCSAGQGGSGSKNRAGHTPCVFLDSHLVSLERNQSKEIREFSPRLELHHRCTAKTALKQCQKQCQKLCQTLPWEQRGSASVRAIAEQKGASVTELWDKVYHPSVIPEGNVWGGESKSWKRCLMFKWFSEFHSGKRCMVLFTHTHTKTYLYIYHLTFFLYTHC